MRHLPKAANAAIKDAQMEAAKVWNLCKDMHQEALKSQSKWPTIMDYQRATKGKFKLHSQVVQATFNAFIMAVNSTRSAKRNGLNRKYPCHDKTFYPLMWPAQAAKLESGRVILPMGRGRKSLVLKAKVPHDFGACRIVWNGRENELHICVDEKPRKAAKKRTNSATVDLGEIHQIASTTTDGKAVVISGRHIRSLKRQMHRSALKIRRLQKRCAKGSMRYRKLQRSRAKQNSRNLRRIRDARHRGVALLSEFLVKNRVRTVDRQSATT